MKKHRLHRLSLFFAVLCAALLLCQATALAASGEGAATATPPPSVGTPNLTTPESVNTAETPSTAVTPPGIVTPPSVPATTPAPETTASAELYPADVQTAVLDNGRRQIVKTYILTPEQNPDEISRESFERDGWKYTLTDITEDRTQKQTDTKTHTEKVTIDTETDDLNTVLPLLATTLDYQSPDGYAGVLTLDLSAVKSEAAGTQNSSYPVTAKREYFNLSTEDTSFIPKTVTENGRTLELDTVDWEAQRISTVDYTEVPEGYRAVATYKGKGYKSVVTGYLTTASYTGEISKTVNDDIIFYTAFFSGVEINPPQPAPTPAPEPEPAALSLFPLLAVLAVLVLLGAGAYAFFFLRRNVKVYELRNNSRLFVAKDKISEKKLTINLSPLSERLESTVFHVDIDKLTAKRLNGKVVEIVLGPVNLNHKIAYEGNIYTVEADFHAGTIKALY